jgi:hypothetical protein
MMHLGGDSQNSEVGFVRLVDQLITYEEGQITGDEKIAFFENLVEAWSVRDDLGMMQQIEGPG